MFQKEKKGRKEQLRKGGFAAIISIVSLLPLSAKSDFYMGARVGAPQTSGTLYLDMYYDDDYLGYGFDIDKKQDFKFAQGGVSPEIFLGVCCRFLELKFFGEVGVQAYNAQRGFSNISISLPPLNLPIDKINYMSITAKDATWAKLGLHVPLYDRLELAVAVKIGRQLFKITYNAELGSLDETIVKNKHIWSFSPTVGLRYWVTENVCASLDYAYTIAQDINFGSINDVVSIGNSIKSVTAKMKSVSAQSVSVGLTYHF